MVSRVPIDYITPIDNNGIEIKVGDTVDYGEGTAKVVEFSCSRGSPFVKVKLENGFVYNAHMLIVIKEVSE